MSDKSSDLFDRIYFQLQSLRQRDRFVKLFEKIAASYNDDPGTSDLYDEQPVTLSIDLGDVRLVRQLLR